MCRDRTVADRATDGNAGTPENTNEIVFVEETHLAREPQPKGAAECGHPHERRHALAFRFSRYANSRQRRLPRKPIYFLESRLYILSGSRVQ